MESKEVLTLRNIFRIIDNLTMEACTDVSKFKGDSINWGDFRCIELKLNRSITLYSSHGEVGHYTNGELVALFSEAAPNGAPCFKAWLEDKLFNKYGYIVEVQFEW